MIKLNKNEYSSILPLVRDIRHNKALIYSVIEGDSDGIIFVDNIETPQNAFIENEFTFVVGNGDKQDFNTNLCSYVFEKLIPCSKDKEAIIFLQTDKKDELEKTFKDKGCIIIERKMFDFDAEKYEEAKANTSLLTDGVELKCIDKEFVGKYNEHHELITHSDRFGYCLVNNDEVLSQCYCVSVGAKEAEISIETNEGYRRKGFAKITATKFIDHCIERGITPIWSCWPFRKESIALATKLGFKEEADIPVIYWAEDM